MFKSICFSGVLFCLSGCIVESMSLPDCHPLFPECGNEDTDEDGVVNKDDDFPGDPSCSVRDKANCTGCGQACGDEEWCSEEYVCKLVQDEVCNGEDEDGDGIVDEALVEVPLSSQNQGV